MIYSLLGIIIGILLFHFYSTYRFILALREIRDEISELKSQITYTNLGFKKRGTHDR